MNKKVKIIYIALIILFMASLTFLGFKIYIRSNQKPYERQAVFLTNGQVYFGYISEINKNFLVLKEIYYLKEQDKLTPNDQTQDKKISIIKLGNELHGPEDQMYISRDQILFYENMKSDSKINDAITKYIESVKK